MSRANQRQIWADKLFIEKLEEIRARKLLKGINIGNLGMLTKMIVSTKAFKQLEQELIEYDNEFNMRMDGKLW